MIELVSANKLSRYIFNKVETLKDLFSIKDAYIIHLDNKTWNLRAI